MAARAKKKDNLPQKDELETSILARLADEYQQTAGAEEEGPSDINVLFCGSKRSGKSSIVDRFINPKKDEKDVPKTTVAMDYKFARRDDGNAKTLAHIYDLGGDDNSANMIPVTPSTVGNLVVAITVDLSEPWAAFPALEKWLQMISERATNSLATLAQESTAGAKRVEVLTAAKQQLFSGHPDEAQIQAFPVSLVIFGTKWDAIAPGTDIDPEKRKGICRALRWYAHSNGASLALSSTKDKDAISQVRSMLRKLVFGADSKGGLPHQVDPAKPLCVLAGKDSLQDITSPVGVKSYRELMAQYFPVPKDAQKGAKKGEGEELVEELLRYPESSIDGMVEQRTEELQQYRRQVERNQRLVSEGVEGSKLNVP